MLHYMFCGCHMLHNTPDYILYHTHHTILTCTTGYIILYCTTLHYTSGHDGASSPRDPLWGMRSSHHQLEYLRASSSTIRVHNSVGLDFSTCKSTKTAVVFYVWFLKNKVRRFRRFPKKPYKTTVFFLVLKVKMLSTFKIIDFSFPPVIKTINHMCWSALVKLLGDQTKRESATSNLPRVD